MMTIVLAGFAVMLSACAPPPPPPAPPTTATSGTFTATASTVGPPKWTYSVTTSGSTNIGSIEFITSIDQSNCTFSPPTGWTAVTGSGSTVISDPNAAGAVTVGFDVECDFTNGPVYLKVTDLGGTTKTLGTIAGPV